MRPRQVTKSGRRNLVIAALVLEFAGGTDRGPPLVHKWYHPGHHADAAFLLAAKRGVPQHHWNFGNMPPLPQVGDRSLQQIIAYVRELQQANGIY